MDLNEQRKYVFIKEYVTDNGTIPEGTEIILFRGLVYINGGMADPYSSHLIMNIISDKKKSKEYLKQGILINNQL